MAQPPFALPCGWPLHYQHREPTPSGVVTSARREHHYGTHAHTHVYRHAHAHAQTLVDAQQTHAHTPPCKGEEEAGPEYICREHLYHVAHRCGCAYGKCGEVCGEGEGEEAGAGAGGRERDEPLVSSSASEQHWDEKIVSSSLCATGAPRSEAASPHQLVTTTHAGVSGGASGRRGALQLWQFLVALLAEGARCVAWTGRGLEFKLHEPEEVARRWGAQKNRPAMNYDKLSRSLRYYYEKGIMQKVAGERYVYKFVCDPEALFSMAAGVGGAGPGAGAGGRSPPRGAAPACPAPRYDVISQLYGGVVYPQYIQGSPGTAPEYANRRYYHHHINHLGHYDT